MRGFALGLLGCCLGLTPALAGEWAVEEVGEVGMYSDLAVADDGTPHVALCGARDDLGKILHATRGRGGWERVVVGALGGRAAAGQVAIALDDDGRPAILFASEAVELWRQGRTGWAQQASWSTWQGNGECQLVLAFADGEPVAFVYDPYKEPAIQVAVGKRLKALILAEQAKQGGGLAVLEGKPYAVWQQETEDFDDPVVYSPQGEPPTALVANTVLRPRVAARGGVLAVLSADREGRREVLRVHTLRDGAWSTLPGVTFDVDQGPWFALGPDGAPHLLLTEEDAGSGKEFVTYAVLRDGAWKSSRIKQELGTRMALQVDGRSRPHVIFADRQSQSLFYATPRGELTFAKLEAAPAAEAPAPAGGGAREPEGDKPPRAGWGEGSGGGSSGGSGASVDAAESEPSGASKPSGEGKPAEPAAKPLTGPEAEAIAAEVRDRAERWLDLREGDTLRCRDCKGSARQRCTFCRGTERLVCPACRGEKRIALPKAVGERQRYENCGTCKKKGELKCEGCEGGEQPCDTCEDTPGYRELAGNRAFWKYVAPSVRNQEDRDAFVAAVLKGERLADVVGQALSFERPQITRVDVFSNEVIVVARVVWAGETEEAEYRTTWFREDRRFYLATGPEDREPLVDPAEARAQPEAPAADPAPAADRAEVLLRMARNYMANGAYGAALRKLDEAAQQPLSEAQQVALDELQARCRIELDARR